MCIVLLLYYTHKMYYNTQTHTQNVKKIIRYKNINFSEKNIKEVERKNLEVQNVIIEELRLIKIGWPWTASYYTLYTAPNSFILWARWKQSEKKE